MVPTLCIVGHLFVGAVAIVLKVFVVEGDLTGVVASAELVVGVADDTVLDKLEEFFAESVFFQK